VETGELPSTGPGATIRKTRTGEGASIDGTGCSDKKNAHLVTMSERDGTARWPRWVTL
jgi:hypothetical protein